MPKMSEKPLRHTDDVAMDESDHDTEPPFGRQPSCKHGPDNSCPRSGVEPTPCGYPAARAIEGRRQMAATRRQKKHRRMISRDIRERRRSARPMRPFVAPGMPFGPDAASIHWQRSPMESRLPSSHAYPVY